VWKRSRPDIAIHLELGAMSDPADLAFLIETIGPKIDSIGLNFEELSDLARHWSLPVPEHPVGIARILEVIAMKGRVQSAVVHAASFALSFAHTEPGNERAALLVAAAVASTRAAYGCYPEVSDLERIVESHRPHPAGLQLLRQIEAPEGVVRYAEGWLVAVPTIKVGEPVVNVGLGDCFTAGLLAMT
jgi:ADP-dependent phosphofructokinase/glucokinase